MKPRDEWPETFQKAKSLVASDDDLHDIAGWFDAYYGGRPHCYQPEECSAVILAEWMVSDWASDGRARIQSKADGVLLENVQALR